MKKVIWLIVFFIFCSFQPVEAEFVRGLWEGKEENFDTVASLGFNLVVSGMNDTKLKKAKEVGLNVIPPTYRPSQQTAELLKKCTEKYDNVFAFYPFDEPDLYHIGVDTFCLWSKRLKEADPSRPIFVTIWNPKEFKRYSDCYDILSPLCYPIREENPRANLREVHSLVRYAVQTSGSRKSVIAHIQAFRQFPWWRRAPTPLEYENVVWQAVLGGASGIILFTSEIRSRNGDQWILYEHRDLLESIKKTNQRLIETEAIWMKGNRERSSIFVSAPTEVLYQEIGYREKIYLLIVNTSYEVSSCGIGAEVRKVIFDEGMEIEKKLMTSIELKGLGYGLLEVIKK